MNGVNNQSINPMITQSLEFFQEPAGSAHDHEVEVNHLQETEDVNAVKSSKWKANRPQPQLIDPAAATPTWSRKENKRFIALKQQQPTLTWIRIAEYFPGRTNEQCRAHWSKVLAKRLYQNGQLIDTKAKQIDVVAETRLWTREENEQFITLKQEQPNLPWNDFAEYFPRHTGIQCERHWRSCLKQKLIRKQQAIADENDNNRPSKRLRTEPSGPAISTTLGENTNLSVNSSQEIPRELAILSVSSPSNSLQELQKIVDSPLYHYEGAVSHFQQIQLRDPLLQSFQQEAAQCLANTQMTYQMIKQRLTETDHSPLIQEAKSLANLCQTSTYYFETVYQHFLSYQTNQESKEWFFSQSEEFANLYLAFFKGKIDEMNFHHLTSLQEKEHCYKKLNNSFIQYRDNLKKYSSSFSLEYNKFIDESFFNIRLQLNLLKHAQQDWKSIASGLEEVLSRLQEIEVFLRSFFDHISSNEIESNIIARIRNEISLQDFYTKQADLIAVQKEGV